MTSNDVTIEGLRIEKGTVVNIPIYAIHHNAEIWPDPYKFDPTRYFIFRLNFFKVGGPCVETSCVFFCIKSIINAEMWA